MPLFLLMATGLAMGISVEAGLQLKTPGTALGFFLYGIIFLGMLPGIIFLNKHPKKAKALVSVKHIHAYTDIFVVVMMALTGVVLHLMILNHIPVAWDTIGLKTSMAAFGCYMLYPMFRKLVH